MKIQKIGGKVIIIFLWVRTGFPLALLSICSQEEFVLIRGDHQALWNPSPVGPFRWWLGVKKTYAFLCFERLALERSSKIIHNWWWSWDWGVPALCEQNPHLRSHDRKIIIFWKTSREADSIIFFNIIWCYHFWGSGIVFYLLKNPPTNAGDADSIPGSGRSPGEGNGNSLQDSCLEIPMDRGTWQAGYSPWGHKKSDTI